MRWVIAFASLQSLSLVTSLALSQPGAPPPAAPPPASPPGAPTAAPPPAPADAPLAPSPQGPPPPVTDVAPPVTEVPPPPPPATEPPPPAGPPPAVVMEPPPPPLALADGTARRHDGFYLRLGIGIGRGDVKAEASVADFGTGGAFEATYSGYGPSYELLIGGTPGGGFVIGGGFVGQDISSPEIESDAFGEVETDSDDALGLVLIGPFVDWFPDETGGAHVGAMLGIAGIGLGNGSDDDETSGGWGASLWAGYDFWIADQWALGAEARAAYLSTKRDIDNGPLEGQIDDRGTSFQLLFTALHH